MNEHCIDRSGCTATLHGTKADYHRSNDHCRCPDAVEAERLYRKHLKHGHRPVRSVPAIGCARRLQALAVLGWSLDDLVPHIGLTRSVIAVIRRGERTLVRRSTYKRIAGAYERLSGPAGPGNAEARRRARLAGWVPPLAWEDVDIDDPTAQPTDDKPVIDRRRRIDLAEVEFFTAGGMTLDDTAVRLGVPVGSIRVSQARARQREVAA